MQDELRLTASTLPGLRREAEARGTGVQQEVGLKKSGESRVWLVPPRLTRVSGSFATLHVQPCRSASDFLELADVVVTTVHRRQILLGLGTGELTGETAAILRMPGKPPESLSVRISGTATAEERLQWSHSSDPTELWAATRNALGERAWEELRTQHIAIVGAGRTGSLVAEALHRIGARLTLIDTDRIEAGHVGEATLINTHDVGHARPTILASRLCSIFPDGKPVDCMEASIGSLDSLRVIRDCSLLVTALDNSAARLFCSLLAQLYLIPLLDLGTSIEFGPPVAGNTDGASAGSRTMRADIRLCLPDRCLLCTGGLPDPSHAASRLLNGVCEPESGSTLTWLEHRGGGLRSLSGCAVNLGLRMVEDWFSRRIPADRNRLMQLRFDTDGTPRLNTADFGHLRISDCSVCALGGHGDVGLRKSPRGTQKNTSGRVKTGLFPVILRTGNPFPAETRPWI
jgi:hypothetical protein